VDSGIWKPLGPRDPMTFLGAKTPIRVRGSGRVLGSGTWKLLDHVALP
jgi:hypothetical protein